jgi:hypothetical protein
MPNNLDTNGFELPWELLKEEIPPCKNPPSFKIRYKIVPNPLWQNRDLNSPEFALSCCFRDAIMHMNQHAARAIMLHIRDAHKWKEE